MSRKNRLLTREDHTRKIMRLVERAAGSYSKRDVFRDFCEMAAIAISNRVDPVHREDREKRYLAIMNEKRYPRLEDRQLFGEMFAELVFALCWEWDGEGPQDILGRLFFEIGLADPKWRGQAFTPMTVARMMAEMTLGDGLREEIEKKGFVTVMEPACGAGALVIGIVAAMAAKEIPWWKALHVHAIDVDPTCVAMTYVQLSLLGVPAIVMQGNSLTMEMRDAWFTPMHVWGGWTPEKLRGEEKPTRRFEAAFQQAIRDAREMSFLPDKPKENDRIGAVIKGILAEEPVLDRHGHESDLLGMDPRGVVERLGLPALLTGGGGEGP